MLRSFSADTDYSFFSDWDLAMTTPTNWPNPERPGVPMFPERDGWHMTTHSGATSPTVSFWCASEGVWKNGASSYPPDYLAHPMRRYIGPVLTPTQISEMLAGERERCAKICDKLADDFLPCHPSEYAWEIRNLGDAP